MVVVHNKFCILGRLRDELGIEQSGQRLSYYTFEGEHSVALFTCILSLYLSGNRLISVNPLKHIEWLIEQSKLLK